MAYSDYLSPTSSFMDEILGRSSISTRLQQNIPTPQMYDDPYGSAYGATPSAGVGGAGTNTKLTGIGQYSAPTTAQSRMTTGSPYGTTPSSSASSYSPFGGSSMGGRTSTTTASPIPYGSRSTWKPQAGAVAPKFGALPEYLAPKINEARVSSLQEKAMGAPMGQLRRGLQQSLTSSRYIENPAVRAMMERETLGGYGAGISDIRTGAGREAMSMYMPEFQAAGQKAASEYSAGVGKVQSQFQADLSEYLKRGTQTTTPVQGRYQGSSAYPITWS